MRAFAFFALFFASFSFAELASVRQAEAARAALFTWSAPPECPSEASVRNAVERLLRRPLDAGEPPPLSLQVLVHKQLQNTDQHAFRLRLLIESPEAPPRERTLVAETCDALADAATLIIAIAIDPGASPGALSKTPSPPPVVKPPVVLRPALPKTKDAKASSSLRSNDGVFFDVKSGVDLFALPSPTLGFRLGGGLRWGKNRVELLFSTLLEQRTGMVAGQSRDAVSTSVGLSAGLARACRDVLAGKYLELLGCAGLEVGAIHYDGTLYKQSNGPFPSESTIRFRNTSLWFGPEISFVGRWPLLSSLALALETELLVPLLRSGLDVSSSTETAPLYRAPFGTFRALLGVEVPFP